MNIPHWLHHIFNPHCPVCEQIQREEFEFERDQFEAKQTCYSCENLKMELARAHRTNELLIEKLTEKPVIQETSGELNPEIARQIKTPWRLKKQLLEEADADKARVLKGLESVGVVSVISENDLDAELASLKGN